MATPFHVLGAGSLGLLFAHRLRSAGLPVTLVLRSMEAAENFRRAGCKVWLLPLWQKAGSEQRAGCLGRSPQWESSQGFGVTTADAMGRDDSPIISHLVVATKAHSAVRAIRTVLPRLAPGAHVVLLQNGALAVAEQLEHELHADLHAAGCRLYVGSVTHGCYREAGGAAASTTPNGAVAGTQPAAPPQGGPEPHVAPLLTHAPTSPPAAPLHGCRPFSVVHAGNGQVLLGPLGPDVLSSAAASSPATPRTARPHAPPDGDGDGATASTAQAVHDSDEAAQFVRTLAASVPDLGVVPALDGAELRRKLLTKLAINCTINPLTAMLGCNNGAIAAQQHTRDVVMDVCRELEAVFPELAASSGTQHASTTEHAVAAVQAVAGNADSTACVAIGGDGAGVAPPARAAPEGSSSTFESVMAVARVTAHNVSSMLQDVRARRPTEVEYLNAYVVRQAAKLGVPAPVNSTLYRLVKAAEAHNVDGRCDA